jgi:hypothetical protein
MPPKKASMNLQDALEATAKPESVAPPATTQDEEVKPDKQRESEKKKSVPFYVHPNLHDAMQSICFAERGQKMNMQKMLHDGLDLLFQQKGYPSVDEIISGEKKIKL